MAERKRKPLSLKRPRVDQSDKENDDHEQQKISKTEERYLFDVTLEDITKFKEGECPLNTEKNTEWAVRNFEAWQTARNKKFEEQCSSNILSSTDMKEFVTGCVSTLLIHVKLTELSILRGAFIFYYQDYSDTSDS